METKPQRVEYSGKVARIESDGFGIIQFDHPIGANGSSAGVISNSTATVILGGTLRPGVHVHGTAETDNHELAAVKTVIVSRP
jgi:hypothetical protein